ncbi:MAG: N-acetyltransferase family protein [Balneolaceae bacterium]
MDINPKFRPLVKSDWPSVSEIYRLGLETRLATFETTVPTWGDWDSSHLETCRIIAEVENRIAGWAVLSPVSKRKVYEGVAEVTIYIHPDFSGRGIGSALMNELIVQSEVEGFWTLQSSVFPENIASIRLHLKHRFREVGYREKIAQLDGEWRNTMILERRVN